MLASNNRKTFKIFFIFAALYTCFTLLRIGNPDVRVANAISDDHPAVYAHYSKSPENWKGDSLEVTGPAYLASSIQNWLTAYLYKNYSIDPSWLSFLFVWIQNVGLALALLLYCRYWCDQESTAWLVAIATFAAQPWASNLAYYPNVMHSPYPGHLVVPFLVLAAVFFLKQQWFAMTLSLMCGALTHPTHTIHLLMILGFCLCFDSKLRDRRFFLIGIFSFIVGFAAFPPLFLVPTGSDPLTGKELIPTIVRSMHLTPWRNDVFTSWELPTFIGIVLAAGVALHKLKSLSSQIKIFYWANILSVLMALVLQAVGVYAKIPSLILFCPLRVSVLNALFLLPIAFHWAVDCIKNPRWEIKVSSLLFIFFQIVSTTGFFWAQLFPLAFISSNQLLDKKRKPWIALCLSWIFLLLLCGRPLREMGLGDYTPILRYLLAPAGQFKIESMALIAGLVLTLLLIAKIFMSETKWYLMGFGISLIGLSGLQTYQQGRETAQGYLYANYEIQKWAKDHTSVENSFITQGQVWRGISERRTINAVNDPIGLPAYFKFRELKNHNLAVNEFYQSVGKENLNELNESDLVKFKEQFGGNYVVRNVSSPTLKFPVVFKNSSGIIYQLEAVSNPATTALNETKSLTLPLNASRGRRRSGLK